MDIEDKEKIVITEGYRPKQHQNDLHGQIPVRAIDIRSWIYICPQKLADKINFAWIYDPTRLNMKVAIYHRPKKWCLALTYSSLCQDTTTVIFYLILRQ